jgi:hypothetical protein
METSPSVAERAESYATMIQTPDSWARSIIALALSAAKEARSANGTDEVTIPAEIHMKFCKAGDPNCNGGNGGMEVCVTLHGRKTCLNPFPVNYHL